MKGEGNQQDYGMRIYDPRLGRFLSVDPLTPKYPELTPYQFASNCPIAGVDQDGLEFAPYQFIADYIRNTYYEYKYGDPTGVKGFYNASVEKAAIQTGQKNYHNDQVPEAQQKILDNINTKKADGEIIQNSVKLSSWITEKSADGLSTFLPVEELSMKLGKELFSLVKNSGRANSLVVKYAEKIIAELPKGKLPRAVTVIVDKKTGHVYEGISKTLTSTTSQISPRLKLLLPKESLEKWPVLNCSECDAFNKALKSGADVNDLEMHTLKLDKKTGAYTNFERCQNCKVTTKDVKTTSQ